ncbi:PfkB family carbohydrate kinase, partial [Klebsiella pneumoniae]
CQQKGCEVILDISHPVLRQLLEWRPLLIKPNDDELKEIFGLDVSSPRRVREAMQTLHQLGARNVLLTLGAQGLYFSNGAQLWFCSAPKIELVSSACAGDAALGAFLSHWLNTDDIPQALAL